MGLFQDKKRDSNALFFKGERTNRIKSEMKGA